MMVAAYERVCCTLLKHQPLLLMIDMILDTLGICPW